MLYVRLQETLWPGFCYCLVVREQRPPLTVCLQSADNVHSLIKRCSQRGIYAVNNSQKPPLSIRRPTLIHAIHKLIPVFIIKVLTEREFFNCFISQLFSRCHSLCICTGVR